MVVAINHAPKGYKSPRYDKARTVGLDLGKAKIKNALGKFKILGMNMGYPLYLMVGEM